MKRLLILLTVLAINAKADPFEVYYSIHGLGKTIVVDAATANEARRTVEDLFPEAVVYNATKAGPCNCSPNIGWQIIKPKTGYLRFSENRAQTAQPTGAVCEGKADFTMSFRLKDFFSAFVRCFWDPATLSLVERR